MHGTVNVIKDIVNAQLYPIGQHFAGPSEIMRGIDSPKLEGLSVLVVLIETGAAATGGKVDSQFIPGAERVAVHNGSAPLMTGRSVDGYGAHPVLGGIIQIGLGVQPAVSRGEHQVLEQLIRKAYIDAVGSSVIHILIHTGLNIRTAIAQVGCGNACGNLADRHIHQGYHVIQFIQISCNGYCELAPAILYIGRIVITSLGIQVCVTDIEECAAAHHMQVTVMQLLDRGGLESLTPPQPEAEIAGGKHGADVCIIDKTPGNWYVGNLAEKEVLESFAASVIKTYGYVDYLINNALPLMKGIDTCSYEEFQYALSVGVTAPFYLTKLFSSHFSGGASIINISSSRDRMSQPQTESYSAAKGGIAALTHAMAMSFAGRVRVNSISPGWIEVNGETWEGPDAVQQPVGRVGEPKYDSAVIDGDKCLHCQR